MFNCGLLYYEGKGTEVNLEKAAEQGHSEAQFACGTFYSLGTGVERDEEKALYWYEKAARQGNIKATNNLGSLYMEMGWLQDLEKAKYWLELGAKNGSVNAQYNLGVWYYNKEDRTDEERKQEWHWLNQAEANGSEAAKKAMEKLFK